MLSFLRFWHSRFGTQTYTLFFLVFRIIEAAKVVTRCRFSDNSHGLLEQWEFYLQDLLLLKCFRQVLKNKNSGKSIFRVPDCRVSLDEWVIRNDAWLLWEGAHLTLTLCDNMYVIPLPLHYSPHTEFCNQLALGVFQKLKALFWQDLSKYTPSNSQVNLIALTLSSTFLYVLKYNRSSWFGHLN